MSVCCETDGVAIVEGAREWDLWEMSRGAVRRKGGPGVEGYALISHKMFRLYPVRR
jgi:hypothetical protein